MRARLLVVDDDEAVLEYLSAKLGNKYDLTLCASSEEVLSQAKTHRPHLILCDIDMPGMDGGDVSAALYGDEHTRDIPVLFLSQLVGAEKQVGGRSAIAKSAPVSELIARIDALLRLDLR